jgi:hypothetical protein
MRVLSRAGLTFGRFLGRRDVLPSELDTRGKRPLPREVMMSKKHTPVNPALEPLQPLVGAWHSEIRWSQKTHKLVGGPALVRVA